MVLGRVYPLGGQYAIVGIRALGVACCFVYHGHGLCTFLLVILFNTLVIDLCVCVCLIKMVLLVFFIVCFMIEHGC